MARDSERSMPNGIPLLVLHSNTTLTIHFDTQPIPSQRSGKWNVVCVLLSLLSPCHFFAGLRVNIRSCQRINVCVKIALFMHRLEVDDFLHRSS